MERRQFIGSILLGAPALTWPVRAQENRQERRLAGMSLSDLKARYRAELFDEFLPFWDRFGLDHERGGVMHGLDHDGRLVHSNKFHWFQGRGIWVYSYLYNHFGRNPEHLGRAASIRGFLLKHFPQEDGNWAELVSRDGRILQPFRGDLFGMYFGAEGLFEYAEAAQDEESHLQAMALMRNLYERIHSPSLELGRGAGARPQGIWMVNLQIATACLRRRRDSLLSRIADECIEMIMNRHWNPDLGLNNEWLDAGSGRPAGEENQCIFGHSIECLWMVMDEAERRGDRVLFEKASDRVRRHLEAGWDHVYGGLINAVNVGQGCYQWPLERPVGTELEFREVGEYHYMKSSWALDEVLIAAMKAYQASGAQWAARFFSRAQQVMDEKFSLKPHGYPLWLTFLDRRMSYQPRSMRKENYHRPRQFMLNLQALDRMPAA